jgi:D-aminoacyl-tRNA deacylase
MLAIVVSRADEASKHVGEQLLDLTDWNEHEDGSLSDASGGGTVYRTDNVELRTFDTLHLHLDGAASAFDEPDLLVFASRHAGDTGPILTAHAIGNFGPAEYGGRAGSLARAAPNALSVVREALAARAPPEYDVGIECTHHGPSTVGCPSLFVEVGSGETQWRDPEAAKAVARAILELRGVAAHRERTIVGFGGGHYAPRFDRVLTETDWGVGHVAADWAIEAMGDPNENRAIIAKAFQMSGTEFALVDDSMPAVEAVIEELGFETLSETFLRETTEIPLDLVGRIEAALTGVDEGLRFGRPAVGYTGEFVTDEIPAALLEEINGIDREAVLGHLKETALAHVTTEGGTLTAGPIALADESDRRALIERLASVLESKYDSVDVQESAVIARRESFDPDLARELGVKPGPDFGRLAEGESIEQDGELIGPADVRSARERRFSL